MGNEQLENLIGCFEAIEGAITEMQNELENTWNHKVVQLVITDVMVVKDRTKSIIKKLDSIKNKEME